LALSYANSLQLGLFTNHFLSLLMYLIRRLGRAAIAADAIF